MAAKAAAEGKRIAGLVCKKPAQRWKMLPIRNGAHCSREQKDLCGSSLFSPELTGTKICVPGKAKEELGKRLVGEIA
jgi:hypothetical protein